MTPQQFDEWAAKDRIEPVGYANQMLGLIGWYLHTQVGSKESKLRPEDFMPWLRYQKTTKAENTKAKQVLTAILGRGKQS